jgi:hypothetical protein
MVHRVTALLSLWNAADGRPHSMPTEVKLHRKAGRKSDAISLLQSGKSVHTKLGTLLYESHTFEMTYEVNSVNC